MKTHIITNWREFSSLEDEWNDLLTASESDTIFLTWEWIQAWHDVVGDDIKLFVITVRDDHERLIGIAPFYQYTIRLLGRIKFKALRILADHATGFEYADWIAHTDCQQSVLITIADELMRSSRGWDLIWMPKMSGWSGAYERLTEIFSKAGFLYHCRHTDFAARTLPDSIQSFEDGFSAKRRQQLRRNRRKLTNTGGVAIKRCITPEDLPLFTDALFNLHNQRRLLLGDPGCFIRKPAEADFYRNFLPKALDKGWLRFNALTQDGDIQAIQIGYAYNHTFFQLQEGFNPEYIKGAGNVLRHITIDECIQEGISAYDFLGGFSEHKRRWGAELRQGHDLLVGHPSLKNRLFFLKDIWPTGRYISEEGLFDGN